METYNRDRVGGWSCNFSIMNCFDFACAYEPTIVEFYHSKEDLIDAVIKRLNELREE